MLIGVLNNTCDAEGVGTVIVGANSSRDPDASVMPHNLPAPAAGNHAYRPGDPYPTFVIEIGDSQSLVDLNDAAADYFSARTTIQIYLGIKFWKTLQNGNHRMVAMLYLRNAATPLVPTSAVSFGTIGLLQTTINTLTAAHKINVPLASITGVGRPGGVACNAAGMAAYQITIPTNLLYHGVNPAPAGIPPNISIDLYPIQQAIMRAQ